MVGEWGWECAWRKRLRVRVITVRGLKPRDIKSSEFQLMKYWNDGRLVGREGLQSLEEQSPSGWRNPGGERVPNILSQGGWEERANRASQQAARRKEHSDGVKTSCK